MDIYIKNLSKTYLEGSTTHSVLKQVNATIQNGKVTVLLGPSGSGKSTLLNLLGGIDVPNEGEVWLGETCLSQLKEPDLTRFRHQKIGMIFQFFHLLPSLTVLENILLPTQLGPSPANPLSRARELLSKVGLSERENTLPERLSGGQQQRVAIARALIQSPDVILADEPTGNLDSTTGKQVIELLISLTKAQGKTLIMATHNSNYANWADQVFHVQDQQIKSL